MYKYLFNQKTLFKTIYLTKINKKKKKQKVQKKHYVINSIQNIIIIIPYQTYYIHKINI